MRRSFTYLALLATHASAAFLAPAPHRPRAATASRCPISMSGRGFTSFTPAAFTIRRQVGQLGFTTETEWQYEGERNPLDPNTPTRTVEASGVSVRLYEALLSDTGERVLLKEFLGSAREIAETEIAVYAQLYSVAAAREQPPPPQVGTLLGELRGGDEIFDAPDFREQWSAALPDVPPPSSGNLWLCFAWEGLATVGQFPRIKQEREWWDVDGRKANSCRKIFLKVVAARALQLLEWLHGAGYAHRSIGPSSLLLSSYDQYQPKKLALRAVDLGFCASASMLSDDEVASAMRRGASSPLAVLPQLALYDLHALGYVLLELIVNALRPDPEAPGAVEMQGLKRLVEDVFDGDAQGAFRAYAEQEAGWEEACDLLAEKEGAGWALLQQLVDCRLPDSAGRITSSALLESAWFKD